MLKVGITGGMGSGKTLVCRVFETLGIPVFYADTEAKRLMETDAALIEKIKQLFGEGIYKSGKLDREQLSGIVFNQPEKLQQLNTIVHPATIAYGRQWMSRQNSPYVIKEAAVFFESGSYKDMDVMIGIYAPKDLRMLRTMQRDSIPAEKVLQRMSNQMDENEKMERCDMVITNDGMEPIIPQVVEIHKKLLAMAKR